MYWNPDEEYNACPVDSWIVTLDVLKSSNSAKKAFLSDVE